ncbi:peptidylprolyl isomerase [Frigidibacter albus]
MTARSPNMSLQQRRLFLTLLNAPPEMIEGALDALIDDRLRSNAAKSMGMQANAAQVTAGMEEFAARANLTAEQFVAELEKAGVSAETFRDFVAAGIVWRDVVRARFAGRSRATDAEVERAVTEQGFGPDAPQGPRVLLSEIIIRRAPEEDARARLLADRVATLATTEASFNTAARQYSSAGTRDVGGKLDWMALTNLPEQVRGRIAALKPGGISAPVQVGPGVYAMFLLHERADAPAVLPAGVEALQYAQVLLPGGRSEATLAEAAKIRARADTCDDLYGIASGVPADRLLVQTQPSSALPADLRAELSRLDPGEMSTALTRGDALMVLMLCSRGPLLDTKTVPRDQVRARLQNERLVGFAEAYLAELRAGATIRYP